MHHPAERHSADRHYRPVVDVELVNRPGQFVRLSYADHSAWIAAHRPMSFYAVRNKQGREYVGHYVEPGRGCHLRLVARTLTAAPHNFLIRYANSDRFDLTRSNLRLQEKRLSPDLITPTPNL